MRKIKTVLVFAILFAFATGCTTINIRQPASDNISEKTHNKCETLAQQNSGYVNPTKDWILKISYGILWGPLGPIILARKAKIIKRQHKLQKEFFQEEYADCVNSAD